MHENTFTMECIIIQPLIWILQISTFKREISIMSRLILVTKGVSCLTVDVSAKCKSLSETN